MLSLRSEAFLTLRLSDNSTQIGVMAVLQSQVPNILIAYATEAIPSGLSAALIATTPLFSLILDDILLVRVRYLASCPFLFLALPHQARILFCVASRSNMT